MGVLIVGNSQDASHNHGEIVKNRLEVGAIASLLQPASGPSLTTSPSPPASATPAPANEHQITYSYETNLNGLPVEAGQPS